MGQPELVYWKGSGDVRSDLLMAMKVVGYRLTVVSDIDEIISRPEHNFPKIILVDASSGEAEASQRIIEVTAVGQRLQSIPMIFISYQASKRSAVLKKSFSKLVPVDVPFKLNDLLGQLVAICPVEAPKAKEEQAAASAPAPAIQQADSEATGTKPEEKLAKTVIAKKPLLIPCDEESLKSGNGGEFFGLAENLNQIDDQSLINSHPNHDELARALKQMTARDSAASLHARRVSVLASVISRKMGFHGDHQRSIRIAGLLLNWGLLESHPKLVSYDLLLSQDPSKHKIIGVAFADSAKYVRDSIKDEQAAATIENISKLILRLNTEPTEAMLGAHCALVPELAERSTWHFNKWDSNGAYRAIRKLADSRIYSIPSPVVTEITKSLSEASSARAVLIASIYPVPASTDEIEIKKISDARKEAEETFRNHQKSSIKFCSLRAGMKLAEPVVSLSGKLLLKANVNLTDDLLETLWRSTVITPVKPEITVSS